MTASLRFVLAAAIGGSLACQTNTYAESPHGGPPPPSGSVLPRSAEGAKSTLKIQCDAQATAISPLIYGVAYDIQAHKDGTAFELGATARRWGGNHTTRYNWKHGRAWNTAQDWFFRNVNYTDDESYSYWRFLDDNRSKNVRSALTVPIMGWVAKDTKSVGFPASKYPQQKGFDPYMKEAGNGFGPDGKPLPSLPPSQTSTAVTPEHVAEWVKTIREKDAGRSRSVDTYILDNEPMIWHETHRDVHPEPASYDELLEKTIKFGTAVRKADPSALIAGPAEWGWSAYFYSSVDLKVGTFQRPDRRKHGDVPLLAWYLSQVRAHEKKTGVKLLDIVDVHYYPQGDGLGLGDAGKTDAGNAAKRLRATRSLWDAQYKDESWIAEEVKLIPRLKQWIAENAPGLKIQIGEYNFGAEKHISGGLAQAEALGRFGQEGIYAAYFWKYPPKDSPAFWAFRAYRNFDGKGAAFESQSLPTTSTPGTSAFAARSPDGKRLTVVALNLEASQAVKAELALMGCGKVGKARAFQYTGGAKGLQPVSASNGTQAQLPPSSITVFEYELGGK